MARNTPVANLHPVVFLHPGANSAHERGFNFSDRFYGLYKLSHFNAVRMPPVVFLNKNLCRKGIRIIYRDITLY